MSKYTPHPTFTIEAYKDSQRVYRRSSSSLAIAEQSLWDIKRHHPQVSRLVGMVSCDGEELDSQEVAKFDHMLVVLANLNNIAQDYIKSMYGDIESLMELDLLL